MIRIFNHYLHRRTLVQVLFDLGLIVAAVFAVALSQGSSEHMVSFAASYGLSLAGGMFVINSASGLYSQSHKRSLTQSCARALFALLIGLPLAYGQYSLVPATVSHRDLLAARRRALAQDRLGHRPPGLRAGPVRGPLRTPGRRHLRRSGRHDAGPARRACRSG